MAVDDMRQKQRAWCVAGNKWTFDEDLDFPIVLAFRGQPAIVFIPQAWEHDEDRCELVFGWAFSELGEQRGGWLYLVKRLIYFGSHLGRLASGFAAMWLAVSVVT